MTLIIVRREQFNSKLLILCNLQNTSITFQILKTIKKASDEPIIKNVALVN